MVTSTTRRSSALNKYDATTTKEYFKHTLPPSMALKALPIPQLNRAFTAATRTQPCSRVLNIFSPFTRPFPAVLPRMDPAQARNESTTGKEAWKKRAPYRVHEPNENFDVKYEANCHCGKVKYQLNRKEPLDSKLCHCTTCQTQHAAPFQWAAIFHKEVC